MPNPHPPSEENKPVAENWCYTQVEVVKLSFMWTINNFSLCEKMTDHLKSSTFSSAVNSKLKWCLQISPNGLDEESKDYLSLFLIQVSCNNTVRAKFKFSLLNARRGETIVKECRKAIKPVLGKNWWGYKKFIRHDVLLDESNGYLPEDKLTIFCEVSVIVDTINITSNSNIIKFKKPECHLSNNLGNLLETQKFSDVSLLVNGQELKAHKAILSARSSVFATMFERPIDEGNQNCVLITDVDYAIFREILKFIYTGQVINLKWMANDLLAAADKYSLERLKVMCEETLCNNLSIDNAAEVLILADSHNADQLKIQTIEFINANAPVIVNTTGWKTMINLHPSLIADIFSVLAHNIVSTPKFPRLDYQIINKSNKTETDQPQR